MKILFVSGREADYTRNQVILRALHRIGEVETLAEHGSGKSILLRSLRMGLTAIPKMLSGHYDLVFVGFYGHILMVMLGLFKRCPIVFDAFVSTYDTLITDRKRAKPGSLLGRLALFLDRYACAQATTVLLDTVEQEKYFHSFIHVPANKLASIPVACNEYIFYPRPGSISNNVTTILYYSTYLPVHGIPTILKAANLLKQEPVKFRLIGKGPLYDSSRLLAEKLELKNVEFVEPVSLIQLAEEIARADICLGGHFGMSEKAGRVIPGKIYQMLAMAKPVIATDTPANKELLTHGQSAYLCPAVDPNALAGGIQSLRNDAELTGRISDGGRSAYERLGSEKVVTQKLELIMSNILTNK